MSLETIAPLSDDPIIKLPAVAAWIDPALPEITTASPLLHHWLEQDLPPSVGRTPWSVARAFVMDCQAALDLGYSPATSYADAVKLVRDWLVATVGDGDWKERRELPKRPVRLRR